MAHDPRQKHYTDHSHPLHEALRSHAASGNTPDDADFRAIPGYADSATVRVRVKRAVEDIHRTRNQQGSGAARALADDYVHRIGADLTEYDMPEDPRPTESVADIGARMFRR